MYISALTGKEQMSATLISKLCWHVSKAYIVLMFMNIHVHADVEMDMTN